MTKSTSRREFLRLSAGFSALGGVAPFALQMAAAGSAAAATSPSDYKALVFLFLAGGQDCHNFVLATDDDTWGRYTTARNVGANPINLLPPGAPAAPPPDNGVLDQPRFWGGVKPIVPRTPQGFPEGTVGSGARTFAVHPMLAPTVPLFEQGRMAVIANVGTLIQPTPKAKIGDPLYPLPFGIASHNDQQSFWQAGGGDGAQTGWGGAMADVLVGQNGANTVFTAISTNGAAVFLSGSQVSQYQIDTGDTPGIAINGRSGALLGSKVGGATLDAIINSGAGVNNIIKDYAQVVARSITASKSVNAAFDGDLPQGIPAPPDFFEPVQGFASENAWATQLHTVAQMVAAAPSLGIRRQVFFLKEEAFDTHGQQNPRDALNYAQLGQALAYFDSALANVGGLDMRNCVTTFTGGDFGRTFTSNGDGTDHAWASHHLIMGGAVNGGDIYGQYPTLGVDGPGFFNPNMQGNNLIPNLSVDQYAATLGRWFGVSDGDLSTIFPRLKNFDVHDLGFMKT